MELHIPLKLNTITTFDTIKAEHGGENAKFEWRIVAKSRLGMTVHDCQGWANESYTKDPSRIMGMYKKGVIQTIQYKPVGGDYWFTALQRKGKKITLVDVALLVNLKVGTVNSCWTNTDLHDYAQYERVHTKSWDSYVFRMNTPEPEAV